MLMIMASSSTHSRSTAASSANAPLTSAPTAGEKSFFETQREVLVSEIAIVSRAGHPISLVAQSADDTLRHPQSLEHVLQNMNKLNRSLEGVIAVSISG